jgi:hypothetical protein
MNTALLGTIIPVANNVDTDTVNVPSTKSSGGMVEGECGAVAGST